MNKNIPKKIWATFLIFFVGLSVIASGCIGGEKATPTTTQGGTSQASSAQPEIVLKVANYYAPEHPVNVALEEVFKPLVEYKSHGKIKVEIYPASQLGGEREFIEGVIEGTIEMCVSGNLWSRWAPQVDWIELGYVWKSLDQAYKFMNGPAFDMYHEFVESKYDVKYLGSFIRGWRVAGNNVRPVRTPEDAKGIKYRVWESEWIVKTVKAMGFEPVTMPIGEVISALETGTVDGAGQPVYQIYYAGWYKYLKYISLTNHVVNPGEFWINGNVWRKLGEMKFDDKTGQDIIQDAVYATIQYINQKLRDEEAIILQKLDEYPNVELIKDVDREAFAKRCKAVHEEFFQRYPEAKKYYDIAMQIEP
ncbi:MAG: TRAP-type transport system periplasmic protein [Thermococcaceae archaeon]|jgi:TRAP-type C4-dicarboxylate transport system substrate-binding protein|nr:TRAP-type transport system periplasmic protein [Thermococcaceae archaeon]MDN5320697.1 TRAP-type transport system periplasmic protein [Thermococcaceae archaeon]